MKKIALIASLCLSVGLLYGCGVETEKEKPVEPKKEETKVGKEENKKPVETKKIPQKQYIYNDEEHAVTVSWSEEKGVLQAILEMTAFRETAEGKKESSRQETNLTGILQNNGQILFKTASEVEIKGKVEGDVLQLELPDKKDKTKLVWFSFKPGTSAEYEEIVTNMAK